ncbi:hypothetical protein L3V82_11540 [Thiotrichales bacterium 19S3-7]|nr:hypothetical protein [Thiotrichales bacterium 19S3-7]MCF6802846.1 hypothetical protein [Thiotrichales bacterium 19S3-11]
MPKLFVFDLDETLFTIDLTRLNKNLSLHKADKNYYALTYDKDKNPNINEICKNDAEVNHGYFQFLLSPLYILHLDELKNIFENILKNGDEIAFVTSGYFTKAGIIEFFKEAYGIQLNDNIAFYHGQKDKTQALKELTNHKNPNDIYFIDNNPKHINEATSLGINTIYVDTNNIDETKGNQYIKKLQQVVNQNNYSYGTTTNTLFYNQTKADNSQNNNSTCNI